MISILFLFLERVFKALSDIIKSSWASSIFSLLPPTHWLVKWGKDSQNNKWKLDDKDHLIPNTEKKWYYFGHDPEYKERFFLSSTWLVALTDLWHTSEYVRRSCIFLALIFMSINAQGWHWVGYDVPNIFIWMFNDAVIASHQWIALITLIASFSLLVSAAQLIGFTMFYNVVLRKGKLKEFIQKIKKVLMMLWKYFTYIFLGIMVIMIILLFIWQANN